jgi:hypothetical protein
VLAIVLAVILLTTPDGKPIWVETEHIRTIRPDHDGGCPPRSSAIIRFDQGSTLCVMEKPSEITDKAKR